jgi:hypothetical protein
LQRGPVEALPLQFGQRLVEDEVERRHRCEDVVGGTGWVGPDQVPGQARFRPFRESEELLDRLHRIARSVGVERRGQRDRLGQHGLHGRSVLELPLQRLGRLSLQGLRRFALLMAAGAGEEGQEGQRQAAGTGRTEESGHGLGARDA